MIRVILSPAADLRGLAPLCWDLNSRCQPVGDAESQYYQELHLGFIRAYLLALRMIGCSASIRIGSHEGLQFFRGAVWAFDAESERIARTYLHDVQPMVDSFFLRYPGTEFSIVFRKEFSEGVPNDTGEDHAYE